MSQPYLIPARDFSYQEEIKRSRFIVDIAHTADVAAAKHFIQSIRQRYPDAGHHCFAFVASRPGNSIDIGASDDGEPSGTAGRPMLAQLQGAVIGEICAVVSRYFGGIKLGTGGLVKAYGGTLKTALMQLPTIEKIPQTQLNLVCEYTDQSQVFAIIAQYQGKVLTQEFSERVTLSLSVPSADATSIQQHLIDLTQGRVLVLA